MYEIDIYNLEFINSTLRTILREIEEEFGSQVITSLYRINDIGVHGTLPLRGVDLRSNRDQYDIERYVNDNWIYDQTRPNRTVCMVHDAGQGVHIHLQVHPNTFKEV